MIITQKVILSIYFIYLYLFIYFSKPSYNQNKILDKT